MKNINLLLRNLKAFRFLVFLKRNLVALIDNITPVKHTYSQHGEDEFVCKMLLKNNINDGIYIEVGANQPTSISNTYLFYRQGLQGILIEPDESLVVLLKKFRPRDTVIQSCCGATSGLVKLNFSYASVLNTIGNLPSEDILKYEYIPQITLDQIVDLILPKWIYFLSIDTEGYDYEVLQGALRTIDITYIICIEYNSLKEKNKILTFLLSKQFELIQDNNLNMIFRNTKLFCEFINRN
jgi:FkbM family methyltransferase